MVLGFLVGVEFLIGCRISCFIGRLGWIMRWIVVWFLGILAVNIVLLEIMEIFGRRGVSVSILVKVIFLLLVVSVIRGWVVLVIFWVWICVIWVLVIEEFGGVLRIIILGVDWGGCFVVLLEEIVVVEIFMKGFFWFRIFWFLEICKSFDVDVDVCKIGWVGCFWLIGWVV